MEEWGKVFKAARSAVPLLLLLLWAGTASAQSRDRFVEALANLTTAVDGTFGDEGPQVTAAIETMSASLVEWNGAVATGEARFAEAVKSAPPDERAKLHASLAVVYLDRGRLADAARELDASVRIDPASPDVQAVRALVLMRIGAAAEARAAAEAAWQAEPMDPVRALLAARMPEAPGELWPKVLPLLRPLRDRLLQARAPGAPPFPVVSVLDDSAAPVPVLGPPTYARGYGLVVAGDYDAALEHFRKAAAGDPLVTSPVPAEAAAALRRGEPAAAVTLLTSAAAREKAGSEVHRILAMALRGIGQTARAVAQFEMAIEQSPADDRASLALAETLASIGETARAEQALLEAARHTPPSGQASFRLGVLYRQQQREAEALQAFEAAAAAPPLAGAARLWTTIGELRENQLQPGAAVEAFRQAVRVDPNDASAHRELGEVLLSQGEIEAASASLLTSLLIDPLDAAVWTGIAQLDAIDGRHEDSLAAADRAIALDERHREAHYARAQALLRLGRGAEGQAALEVFRALQAEAMEEQRRTYERNLRSIEAELQKQPGDSR